MVKCSQGYCAHPVVVAKRSLKEYFRSSFGVLDSNHESALGDYIQTAVTAKYNRGRRKREAGRKQDAGGREV